MAWHKSASAAQWITVNKMSLLESIEYLRFYAVRGIVSGLIYGVVIGLLF